MTKPTVKGDCETCSATDIQLTQMHGNMMMCPACVASENEVLQKNAHAKQVITDSRAIDSSIELKQDLFNAGTVSFIALQAAIEANTEIAADKKNFALMTEVAARIEKLNAAIFEEEAALITKKNERHALLINAQNVAAKLHEQERIKFKQYDINYKPVTPKSVKPKAIKTSPGKPKFDKTAVYEAAKKYNVPAAQIQSLIVSRNMSPEDAGKHMAELLGLI